MEIIKNDLKKQMRTWIRQGYIQPEEIPNIDLYVEQVIRFMDKYLSGYKRGEDDKTLTKTMVNNYTKNELLPPTDKKRYGSDHVILLILIYYMKNVISISDIRTVLGPLVDTCSQEGKEGYLTEIYKEMYDLEKHQYFNSENSILKTLDLAQRGMEGKDDEYLKNLIFLCLLGYDIFVKRKVMEHIIDTMAQEREAAVAEEEKKKEAADKAAKQRTARDKNTKAKAKPAQTRPKRPQK